MDRGRLNAVSFGPECISAVFYRCATGWGVAFSEIHRALSDSLVDPRSVQYKQMHLVRHSSGATLCGMMNWKNSEGHYQPFVQFFFSALVGGKREAFIAPNLDDSDALARLVDAGCTPQ